jgi:hypothetical protein
MDPASADLLRRAADAPAESARLIREAERPRAVLAASRVVLAASRRAPPSGSTADPRNELTAGE